jgi:uncharacterized alkaline shock family protein YloU
LKGVWSLRNFGAIVLGLIFITIAALITAISFGWTDPILNLVQNIASNIVYSLLAAIGFLLLAVLAFSLVKVRETEQVAVITASKYGQIRISDRTVEEIITRVGLRVDGIKEITPKVFPLPEGINIGVQVLMNPEYIIPQVIEEMQDLVKTDVEKFTGLKVAEVKVMVRGIDSPTAVRIR